MKNYSNPGWTKQVALSAAALCVAVTAARAQTVTTYGTGFDGTDTVNGTATAATYNSPATPTDPLDGQNNWGTNDPTQTGTYGTSTQLIGRSDFVGGTGFFTGQTGALGGIYRTTSPTGAAPDVVPSTASGGIVTLYHAVSVGAGAPFVALNTDFAVTAPGANGFATHDTFSFSLQSTTFASLININFQPSTSNPTGQDEISYTVGGITTTTGNLITLNGSYHLALTVTAATKTFTATISQSGGGTSTSFSGSLATASIAPSAVGEVVALWNLANKTATSGAYQSAGDNSLIFDNLAVTVPEPSTYAMMALGLVGLAGVLRLRRQQA